MTEVLARHDAGDVIVGEGEQFRSKFELVFDGPEGLETVIAFDEVAIEDRRVEFFVHYQLKQGRSAIYSGSIEAGDLGDVGAWLREHGRVVSYP